MSGDVGERVRAALTARADLVTADSLRPEQPPGARPPSPRSGRRRGWRARPGRVLLTAAAAVLVVVALGALATRLDGRPAPHRPADPPTRIALEGVAFEPPAGWVYRLAAEGIGCLQPAGAPLVDGGCTPHGVELRVGEFVGWPKNFLDSHEGWSLPPPNCRGASDATDFFPEARLAERATRRIGDRTAEYRVWRVRCGPGPEFTVRLWWQPEALLAVYTVRLDPRYDAEVDGLVASVRF